MSRRVGILGGTFDPIHAGHLDLGEGAQTAIGLTEVLVVPSHVPPHRPPPQASGYHRFAMAAIAVSGRPGWRVSDVELENPALSYTATTLDGLQRQGYSPGELFFLIGADAFAAIVTWKDYPAILDRAHFAVVSRPTCPVESLRATLPDLAPRMIDRTERSRGGTSIILIDLPTADVSSTAIRARRAAGLSVAGLVPDGVRQHIEQHGLYSEGLAGRREPGDRIHPAAGGLHGQS